MCENRFVSDHWYPLKCNAYFTRLGLRDLNNMLIGIQQLFFTVCFYFDHYQSSVQIYGLGIILITHNVVFGPIPFRKEKRVSIRPRYLRLAVSDLEEAITQQPLGRVPKTLATWDICDSEMSTIVLICPSGLSKVLMWQNIGSHALLEALSQQTPACPISPRWSSMG